MFKLLSALSLVGSAPCVLSGQNTATVTHHEVVTTTMSPEPRMGMRRMLLARAAMRPLILDRMEAMMTPDAASMFLAHTGELQLTDAQVTRLAAIARRAEAREHAMRARLDSAVVAFHERADGSDDGDGVAREMLVTRLPMATEAELRARHEDDREAFTVPTPDQLATAHELMQRYHER
jgi:hypothetical protein